MKRIAALLLACILLCTGFAASEEAKEPAEVVSYDFDLQFHLEADTYPFRDRKYVQGYEELLDALEIRGNYSYCAETDCMDLHLEIIPVSNPDAAASVRVFGWVANWLNVSSPLLGESAVCFRPKEILNFSMRAWDFFRIPLFHFAILFPGVLSDAYGELSEQWKTETDAIQGDTLSVSAMERITEGLRVQFDEDIWVTKLTDAAVKSLPDSQQAREEIRRLPDLLLYAADGKDLKVEKQDSDGTRTVRYLNHRGEVIYESQAGEKSFEEKLTLPGSPSDYIPAYAFRREETDHETSFLFDLSWDRIAEDESLPETFLRMKADLEHIPSVYPADAAFSGEVLTEGLFLPNFHYLVNGMTGADGTINLSLLIPDKPETGPVLTCTGTVAPVPYEGELSYMIGDIITDFNLFALSDQSLAELVTSVMPSLTEKIPDLLYVLPTRGVQSLMDTLEKYGLLQTLLQ